MKLTAKRTREILKTIHELKQILLMTDWTIEVTFMEGNPEDGTLADIAPQARYKTASLNIYEKLWSGDDYRPYLTHELLHCVLSPIADLASERDRVVSAEEIKHADEATTSHIAHIISGLEARRGQARK